MGIDDDELARLRRRAYGPDADIASDPAALARLEELQYRSVERPVDDTVAEPVPEPVDNGEEVSTRRVVWPRPRRSTIVLGAVGAIVAVASVVSLTLVQRVQTHPLQPDAVQVARISPDPSFEVPEFFGVGSPGQAVGFTETHGFRAVVTPPGRMLGSRPGEYCMTIFQPELVTAQGAGSWSYDGQYIAPACSAGIFPAAATVRLLPGSPELEHTDFPADTALQFVYDQQSNEVVLFRG